MSRADVAALRERCIRECARERWGEAAAVAVFPGCERITSDGRFHRHADSDGVAWDAVLADRTWSPAERFLIATAAALWTGRRTGADMSRIGFLDDGFFAVWLAMVTAARTGRVQDAAAPARRGGPAARAEGSV